MKTDKKRYLAALLLLMLTALMATGVAYGHYEAKTQKELKFNIQMRMQGRPLLAIPLQPITPL